MQKHTKYKYNQQCKQKMESDEKSFDLMNQEIDNELKTVENIQTDFIIQKQIQKHNYNDWDNTERILENHNKHVLKFTSESKINNISILDTIKLNVLTEQVSKHFEENFDIKITNTENNNNSRNRFEKLEQRKIVKHISNAQANNNNNNNNNNISWKFDYFYDFEWKGQTMHGIENNGKKVVCNHNSGYWPCNCFFCCYSFGMKPQTGKYKIRFKINAVDNNYCGNVIGIVSHNSKTNSIMENFSQHKNSNNTLARLLTKNTLSWGSQLNDYIGWSANGSNSDKKLVNGLYCGHGLLADKTPTRQNIFRLNNFIYKSQNENYKKRLPRLEKGDIIQLSYDSDNAILSFSKEKQNTSSVLSFFAQHDGGNLDAQISNLPKMNTYYWFVGHEHGKMSVSVID